MKQVVHHEVIEDIFLKNAFNEETTFFAVFDDGTWKKMKMSKRGNPYVALNGKNLEFVYMIDFNWSKKWQMYYVEVIVYKPKIEISEYNGVRIAFVNLEESEKVNKYEIGDYLVTKEKFYGKQFTRENIDKAIKKLFAIGKSVKRYFIFYELDVNGRYFYGEVHKITRIEPEEKDDVNEEVIRNYIKKLKEMGATKEQILKVVNEVFR